MTTVRPRAAAPIARRITISALPGLPLNGQWSLDTQAQWITHDQDVYALAIGPNSDCSHVKVYAENFERERPFTVGVDAPFVGQEGSDLYLKAPIIIRPAQVSAGLGYGLDLLLYSRVPPVLPLKRAPKIQAETGVTGSAAICVMGRKLVRIYVDNEANVTSTYLQYRFVTRQSAGAGISGVPPLVDVAPASSASYRDITLTPSVGGDWFLLVASQAISYVVEAYD